MDEILLGGDYHFKCKVPEEEGATVQVRHATILHMFMESALFILTPQVEMLEGSVEVFFCPGMSEIQVKLRMMRVSSPPVQRVCAVSISHTQMKPLVLGSSDRKNARREKEEILRAPMLNFMEQSLD